MKPYYADADVTLYHGDCREIIPTIGGGVDMVLLDPPYGETSLDWDRRVPGLPALALSLLERSKGSLWCFGSMRLFLETTPECASYSLAQDVVWEKHNGTGFMDDRFKRVHELAVQWYPRSVAWSEVYKNPVYTQDATKRTLRRKDKPPHMGAIGEGVYQSNDGGPRLMRSVIYQRSCHGYAVNETQKPEGIIWPLLDYSCPKGGTILDPCAGSGTTGIAARALGMKAIRCEVRESQCEEIVKRLSQQILRFDEVSA